MITREAARRWARDSERYPLHGLRRSEEEKITPVRERDTSTVQGAADGRRCLQQGTRARSLGSQATFAKQRRPVYVALVSLQVNNLSRGTLASAKMFTPR